MIKNRILHSHKAGLQYPCKGSVVEWGPRSGSMRAPGVWHFMNSSPNIYFGETFRCKLGCVLSIRKDRVPMTYIYMFFVKGQGTTCHANQLPTASGVGCYAVVRLVSDGNSASHKCRTNSSVAHHHNLIAESTIAKNLLEPPGNVPLRGCLKTFTQVLSIVIFYFCLLFGYRAHVIQYAPGP